MWIGVANKAALHDRNLTDLSCLIRILREVQSEEIYNLAAEAFVKSSWPQPHLTGNVTGLGAANACPEARFCQSVLGRDLRALVAGTCLKMVRYQFTMHRCQFGSGKNSATLLASPRQYNPAWPSVSHGEQARKSGSECTRSS
jgi:GDP-mannose 4,6 dehydratase